MASAGRRKIGGNVGVGAPTIKNRRRWRTRILNGAATTIIVGHTVATIYESFSLDHLTNFTFAISSLKNKPTF